MNVREPHTFENRREAGRILGDKLRRYAQRNDVVVLALPRGGVPVAYEVARTLNASLDLFLVRKLGTPGHRELAMGAIASGGVRVLNEDVVRWYGITQQEIEQAAEEEGRELVRRELAYRGGRAPVQIDSRIVILVDDGLATGSTMRAAVEAVRQLRPLRVVVAVPVGARETCEELSQIADEVICVGTPEPFSAVGQWYVDFDQTTDDEVRRLLSEHASTTSSHQ